MNGLRMNWSIWVGQDARVGYVSESSRRVMGDCRLARRRALTVGQWLEKRGGKFSTAAFSDFTVGTL